MNKTARPPASLYVLLVLVCTISITGPAQSSHSPRDDNASLTDRDRIIEYRKHGGRGISNTEQSVSGYISQDQIKNLVFETDFRSTPTIGFSKVHKKNQPNKVRYLNSFINNQSHADLIDAAFQDGLAAVYVRGLGINAWGYIDKTGRFAIKPDLYRATTFANGIAIVTDNKEHWLLLNSDGTKIELPTNVAWVYDFKDNFALTKITNGGRHHYGFINRQGKFVIEPVFQGASDFKEGLAMAYKDFTHRGFIDQSGRFVIPATFERAENFSNGLAMVRIEKKWGFIDTKGRLAIKPTYDIAAAFSEGRAMVKVGSVYGYIDPEGKEVIKPQYTLASNFSEGLAAVQMGPKHWQYIDKSGKTVLVCDDTVIEASPFKLGIAEWSRSVPFGIEKVYVNKEGKVISPQE